MLTSTLNPAGTVPCRKGCGPGCHMHQALWTPGEVACYLAAPIPYRVVTVRLRGPWWRPRRLPFALGLSGRHVHWSWKPRENRPPDHQADYDRLEASIRRDGVRTPAIGWRNPQTGVMHILIGQRRAEIAARLGHRDIRVIEILEDATRYWRHDLERIDRHLRPVAGEWQYAVPARGFDTGPVPI